MKTPSEVLDYYNRFPEESRLTAGPSLLEFERTKDILSRTLPAPPAKVVDVGGAAGVYSAWLSGLGYEVHLVDASARLVEEARRRNATLERPIASLSVADARALPQSDGSADVVLIMGPLYHLPEAADRAAAVREGVRVLKSSGVLAVAAISRFASALDGLSRGLAVDPAFIRMRDGDLRNGQHRNQTDRIDYFTTAYFHLPEELRSELEASGIKDVNVFGVEGPAWILDDFERRWATAALREDILHVARVLELERSIVGASAHLLGVGRTP